MLRYRILGAIELYDADRRVAMRGPGQVALLAFLLLHANRGVSTDRLIDGLWSGQSQDGAVKRVQMAVARLRNVLDGGGTGSVDQSGLRTVAGGYLLAVAPGELDAEVFEALVQQGRQALDADEDERAASILREGLGLWRGPALAEVAYASYAQAEIRRLEELRLSATEARVEADLRLGHHAALVAELEALLAGNPTRERLASQLMLALYRCGRQADALEVFRRTRDYLVGELGLEPGPQLQDFHSRVLGHDPAFRPPERIRGAKPVLPVAPAQNAFRLIGRRTELATVCQLLRGQARLVTLTGAAGAGKSRLALCLVEELRSSFDDGVFLVELAPIEDPQLVASTVAQALAVRSQGSETPSEALERHLRGQEVLLVLDNFERVLPAVTLLAALLDAAPRLRLLVTSRVALNLLTERQFEVEPLSLPSPDQYSVDMMVDCDAVRLFIERARAVDRSFALTAENAPIVAAICVRLDGLPLALELAAAWTKLLAPHALLERLESRLSLLTRGPSDLPVRQQALRQTIDSSYRLLAPGEQILFTRLAVFAGGWTLETAETICGADDVDVLGGLATLLDHSLVHARGSGVRERRFVMLETLREYALELLAAGGDEDRLRRRHAEYFRTLVEDAELHLWRGQQEHWLGRLDAEHDNLRAALARRCGSAEADTALRLAAAAAHFWWIRGYLSEGRMWLERTLT